MQPDTSLTSLTRRMRRVSHFKTVPEDDLRVIASAGSVRVFPAGSTIFSEQEPCAGMFVLLSGHVHLYKLGPRGKQTIITMINPVIMFNEVSVLDGGPNLMTAQAIEECITWHVSYDRFQILVRSYPQVGLALLHILAARTRLLLGKYEDLSFRSVLARTAKLLLDLSNYGQQPINRRANSNGDMAAAIATVPEALSRSLQVFKRNGDIVCTRTQIVIRNPAPLARLAEIEPTLLNG